MKDGERRVEDKTASSTRHNLFWQNILRNEKWEVENSLKKLFH